MRPGEEIAMAVRGGQGLALAGVLLASLVAGTGAARADGMYFPEKAVAAPPSIPAQRALVIHRDGVETLVVESSLDAEGQSFGWILPLPARPTALEPTSAGVLDHLDAATAPEITHDRTAMVSPLLWAAVLFVPWAVVARWVILRREKFSGHGYARVAVWTLAFVVVAVFVAGFLLGGRLAGKGGGGMTRTALDASPTRRVGNYEVTVLEARDAAALDGWLGANGFAPLPPAGGPIAAAYVAEGWVFVAARLVREGKGILTPHPLRATFPAKEPVYPMRLTALAGGTTRLRVYLITDGGVETSALKVAFRDRFDGPFLEQERFIDDHGAFRSPGADRVLAHPLLLPDLWKGCTVTRLEGDLGSDEMGTDLRFAGAPGETVVAHFYSAQGARQTVLTYGIPPWLFVGLLLVLLPDASYPAPLTFLRGAGAVTVLVGIGCLACYALLPKIPVVVDSGWRARDPDTALFFDARNLLANTDARSGLTEEGAREIWAAAQFRGMPLLDRLDGEIPWGDRPGEFQLVEDHRGPVLRVWTHAGPAVELPWLRVRAEALRSRTMFRWDRRPTLAGARAAFDGAARDLGVKNPFTGDPVRWGAAPGDLELIPLESGPLCLRVHYREGKFEDLPLR